MAAYGEFQFNEVSSVSERRGFFIYFDDARHFDMLSDSQLGSLIRGLMDYSSCGTAPSFTDTAVSMAFSFLSARDDRDAAAYAEACRKNAENGRKGGRPRKADGFSENPTVFSKTQKSQSETKSESKSEFKVESQAETDDSTAAKPPTRKRFTPPSVDEVKQYCQERGNSVDPIRFVDFYESKGWMIGRNPMRSWKAAVRTWERERDQHAGGFKYDDTFASGASL